MAEIRGTKWNDLNSNGVRDAEEPGLQGWTIFLDDNENAQLDAEETSTTTDANGDYAFTDLESDTYLVAEVPQDGFNQTAPNVAPSSQFDIEIIFADNNLTASQKAIFTTAENTWEQIIIGDVPDANDVELPSGGTQAFIDDLVIEATAPAIDGSGGILGQAGPRLVRGGGGLPLTGIMQFDSADLADLENSGQLNDVILHEMGHVLGIGTIWDFGGRDLLTNNGGFFKKDNPRFTGEIATAQYNQIFNNTETSVPVENTGGEGTRDSHWRESVFDNELMTGFLDGGVDNPLSRITAGSLEDIGYEVDLTAADDYAPPLIPILGGLTSATELEVLRPEIETFETNSTDNSFDDNAPAIAPLGTYLITLGLTEIVKNLNFGAECFLAGTHILTDKGEVTVENLQIGDKVRTANGQLELIKWVGRQTIKPNQAINPLRNYPVLVKAGALGNNLPHRDLYVSPDHSLFVDGLLINAGALVNDISILKTTPTETFTYYHVELENHCLLIAEGTAAESYLPQKENRDEYDNAAEYEDLYPHGNNLMLWPMDHPRISSRNTVPNYIIEKLQVIANQLVGQCFKLKA